MYMYPRGFITGVENVCGGGGGYYWMYFFVYG